MNIVLIIRVKIIVLLKWLYRSPQLCSLLNLEYLTTFEHVVQSLISTCLRPIPNHTPLKYRFPFQISYWMRVFFPIVTDNSHLGFIVESMTWLYICIEVERLQTCGGNLFYGTDSVTSCWHQLRIPLRSEWNNNWNQYVFLGLSRSSCPCSVQILFLVLGLEKKFSQTHN